MWASFASILVLAFATSISGQNVSNIHVAPCDRATKKNDTLVVNYNGTFINGTLFDSSYTANGSDPFSFKLGSGEVITGFDLGLSNMCVGDQRKLVLPPELAYGNRSVGPIPPNSTLIFYTELEAVQFSA